MADRARALSGGSAASNGYGGAGGSSGSLTGGGGGGGGGGGSSSQGGSWEDDASSVGSGTDGGRFMNVRSWLTDRVGTMKALSKGAGQGSPRMQSLSAAMEADSDESDDDDGATTDVRLLRKLVMALKDYEAELRAVFPHYCRRGKYDNVTHLNRKCWRQFAKECGLSAGSKDGGVVDVMFSTGVRHYNQDRFQASTNSGKSFAGWSVVSGASSSPKAQLRAKAVRGRDSTKLTFYGFLAALGLLVRHKYKECNMENCKDIVDMVMSKHVSKAGRMDSGLDEAMLRDDKAADVLRRSRGMLEMIFRHYADEQTRATLEYERFIAFGRDFKILPRMCTQSNLFDIFVAVSHGTEDPITFSAFVEAALRMAITAFSKPFLAPSHKTTVKKVIGFVEWLQRSDKVRQFEVAERTFRAPKALSSEQLQGKFSFKSRRSASNLRIGDANDKTDVSAVSARRQSVVAAATTSHGANTGSPMSFERAAEEARRGRPTSLYEKMNEVDTGSPFAAQYTPTGLQKPAERERGLMTKDYVTVDPEMVQRLCKDLARYTPKLRPVFDFYCRLDDPTNRGAMSFLNFRRLVSDCNALDDFVTNELVGLQLMTVARNRVLREFYQSQKVSRDTAKRPSEISLDTFAGKLLMGDFLEALVRMSELIRAEQLEKAAAQTAEPSTEDASGAGAGAGAGGSGGGGTSGRRRSRSGGRSGGSGGAHSYHAAKRVAEAFLSTRVIPLAQLARTDDMCIDILETPAVLLALSHEEGTIHRLFAYFVNGAAGGARMQLQHLTKMVRALEIVPHLISKNDVQEAFYAVARRYNTASKERIDERPVFFHTVGKLRDPTYITYEPFHELLGRFALLGFSKPYLEKSCPAPADKVAGLFDWIRSSGILKTIEKADWMRGLSSKGRRMSKAQMKGEVETKRKWSMRSKGGAASNASQRKRNPAAARRLAALRQRLVDSGSDLDLRPILQRLRAAAYSVGGVDFERLFRHYDRDNSGQIDFTEFRSALRRDAKLSVRTVSDDQLRLVFESTDEDGSGSIDIAEFVDILTAPEEGAEGDGGADGAGAGAGSGANDGTGAGLTLQQLAETPRAVVVNTMPGVPPPPPQPRTRAELEELRQSNAVKVVDVGDPSSELALSEEETPGGAGAAAATPASGRQQAQAEQVAAVKAMLDSLGTSLSDSVHSLRTGPAVRDASAVEEERQRTLSDAESLQRVVSVMNDILNNRRAIHGPEPGEGGEDAARAQEAAPLTPGAPTRVTSLPPPTPIQTNFAHGGGGSDRHSELVLSMLRQDDAPEGSGHPVDESDALKSVATMLVQKLSRESARQELLLHGSPEVDHAIRNAHSRVLAGSAVATGATRRRGGGSSSADYAMRHSGAEVAYEAVPGSARTRSSPPSRSRSERRGQPADDDTTTFASVLHPGESLHLQRQERARRLGMAKKWVENRRLVHTADWSGEPTRVREFHLSPSRPRRRRRELVRRPASAQGNSRAGTRSRGYNVSWTYR